MAIILYENIRNRVLQTFLAVEIARNEMKKFGLERGTRPCHFLLIVH